VLAANFFGIALEQGDHLLFFCVRE
jgi:hypothetical protein